MLGMTSKAEHSALIDWVVVQNAEEPYAGKLDLKHSRWQPATSARPPSVARFVSEVALAKPLQARSTSRDRTSSSSTSSSPARSPRATTLAR
jgi:hypothetical protein